MAEVKRYTASIMHPGVREDPEGLLVAYHHYAELKAEVEELTGLLKASTYYNTSDEVTRLKAEVERLTAFTTCTIIPNEELKAKLERLTKAGNNLVYVASEHPVAEPFVQAWWKEISHD
jgi:hypothetical protein